MKSTAPKPALAAQGISVDRGPRTVVHPVDLALHRGQLFGLVGPNGSGKTSLLTALAGLLPMRTGTLVYDGRPAGQWTRRALGRYIAYLPQDGRCYWPITVARLVTLGRLPHLPPWRSADENDAAQVARALAATDTRHLAGRPATDLSGGEQARVMLARALAVGAAVLLADEPVSGLDPLHQLQVMNSLRREADRGAAVMTVLHDLTLAMRFCDHVLVLADGEAAAAGAPRSVLTESLIREVYGVEAIVGERQGQRFVLPWRPTTSHLDSKEANC